MDSGQPTEEDATLRVVDVHRVHVAEPNLGCRIHCVDAIIVVDYHGDLGESRERHISKRACQRDWLARDSGGKHVLWKLAVEVGSLEDLPEGYLSEAFCFQGPDLAGGGEWLDKSPSRESLTIKYALITNFDEHRNVGISSCCAESGVLVTPGRSQCAYGLWRVMRTSPWESITWVACTMTLLC